MKKNKDFFNRFKYIYLSLVTFLTFNLLNTKFSYAEEVGVADTGGKFIVAFNDLSNFIGVLTNGYLAFAMLSGIAVLLYHIVQLALHGSNPKERTNILRNLFSCIICIGLLGSLGLVMSLILFYVGV